ncbi:hypothetical protein [Streptomyces sp. NPDC059651]|uniref:hypothetical protein n=1 Tax=Streptomyces sp. NPDC059651 TaxID=3346897 RepID=UPI00367ECA03
MTSQQEHGSTEGDLMNIVIDAATAVVATAAIAIGCFVHRWTAPATTSTGPGTSKGERLLFAVTAAAAVIAIGAYVVGGIETTDSPQGAPAHSTTTTSQAPE